MIQIVEDPIDINLIYNQLADPSSGAVVLFVGRVRNHNDGRSIRRIHYTAYTEMAQSEMNQIAEEARQKFPISQLALVHRIGNLVIGDISIAVAVGTPHRAAAFDGARFLIDTIKTRVPIWKQEFTDEESAHWVDA